MMSPHARTAFPPDPRPTMVPERIAGHDPSIIDHRGPVSPDWSVNVWTASRTCSNQRGHICSSGIGYRGVGWPSSIRVTGRPRARLPERPLPTASPSGRRLRYRVRPLEVPYGDGVSAADSRHGSAPTPPGRSAPCGRAQRDLHRRHQRHRGHPARAHRRRTSGSNAVDPCPRSSHDFRMDEWGGTWRSRGRRRAHAAARDGHRGREPESVDASEKASARLVLGLDTVIERIAAASIPIRRRHHCSSGCASRGHAVREGDGGFPAPRRLGEACRRAVCGSGSRSSAGTAEYSNTSPPWSCPGQGSDAYIAMPTRRWRVARRRPRRHEGKLFRIGHLGSLNELELLGGWPGSR